MAHETETDSCIEPKPHKDLLISHPKLILDSQVGLPVFPTRFQYKVVNSYELKANIVNSEEAQLFIEEYSSNSNSEWRVLRTYKRFGNHILFKRAWRCQYNVQQRNKTNKDIIKNKISKNFECPGFICIVVNNQNNSTKEFPATIKLNLAHSHELNSKEVLRFRTIDADIKNKILTMFTYGHGASCAVRLNLLDLMLINEDQYSSLFQDARYNPSVSQIQHFLNHFKKSKGDVLTVDKIIEEYIEKNVDAVIKQNMSGTDGDRFITILTPFMLRVHEFVPESGNIVTISLSPKINRRNTKLVTITTFSKLGHLPLGIIIIQCHQIEDSTKIGELQTETISQNKILKEAYTEFKNCLPQKKAFYGNSYPKVILTDRNQHSIVRDVWTNSEVLISQKSMLKCVWTWLQNYNNGINFSDLEGLYISFKRIMLSKSIDALKTNFTSLEKLCSSPNPPYPHYITLVKSLMSSKPYWIDCYCNVKIKHLHLDPDIIEYNQRTSSSQFEILSNYIYSQILCKIKNVFHNMNEVLNFILHHYDLYFSIRIMKIVKNNISKSMLHKYIYCIEVDERCNYTYVVQPSDYDSDCYFLIETSDKSETLYYIDYKNKLCSCKNSFKKFDTAHCIHISIILKHIYSHDNVTFIKDYNEIKQLCDVLLIIKDNVNYNLNSKNMIIINSYKDLHIKYENLLEQSNIIANKEMKEELIDNNEIENYDMIDTEIVYLKEGEGEEENENNEETEIVHADDENISNDCQQIRLMDNTTNEKFGQAKETISNSVQNIYDSEDGLHSIEENENNTKNVKEKIVHILEKQYNIKLKAIDNNIMNKNSIIEYHKNSIRDTENIEEDDTIEIVTLTQTDLNEMEEVRIIENELDHGEMIRPKTNIKLHSNKRKYKMIQPKEQDINLNSIKNIKLDRNYFNSLKNGEDRLDTDINYKNYENNSFNDNELLIDTINNDSNTQMIQNLESLSNFEKHLVEQSDMIIVIDPSQRFNNKECTKEELVCSPEEKFHRIYNTIRNNTKTNTTAIEKINNILSTKCNEQMMYQEEETRFNEICEEIKNNTNIYRNVIREMIQVFDKYLKK